LKGKLVALAVVACVALGGAALWFFTRPAPADEAPQASSRTDSGPTDFRHWAVVLVAGDYRAHSGQPSKVFDNARHDLAGAFTKLGFDRANMAQFSVDYDDGTEHSDVMAIASAMQQMATRAHDGCLLYFTSHGTPTGMLVGDTVLSPATMRDMVNAACGKRPTVVVMSSCYSGQFVPALAGDNRIVMTAARPDRTSFGCGEMDHYTYFDDCFLRALPLAGGFAEVGSLVQQCVAAREQQMHAAPPSEPQLSVGSNVFFSLRWKA
jgi:hypothetical protein